MAHQDIVVNGDKFTWQGKAGSTELSDLQLKGFPNEFYIKSQKTGQTRLFTAAERIDNNGDLGGYRYISQGSDIEATLWND